MDDARLGPGIVRLDNGVIAGERSVLLVAQLPEGARDWVMGRDRTPGVHADARRRQGGLKGDLCRTEARRRGASGRCRSGLQLPEKDGHADLARSCTNWVDGSAKGTR